MIMSLEKFLCFDYYFEMCLKLFLIFDSLALCCCANIVALIISVCLGKLLNTHYNLSFELEIDLMRWHVQKMSVGWDAL